MAATQDGNDELGALTAENEIPVMPVQVITRPYMLQQIRGPGSPIVYNLEADVLVVGRADDADIRIGSTALSRRHMRLERYQGGYRAIDLDSSNGVYLNEVRVHSAVLRDGDTLQLGNAVFLFHEGK
ncbi:MAG: FHA domain-containing protein [Deltaproteobacteria bacterium]|nr:FHA domain-containing protein [Deltaproteobacteria bacterium]